MRKKKKLIGLLTTLLAVSFYGNVLAAPDGQFNDVPKDHWAYQAVNALAKAGIIDGYGDQSYQGDKIMTRYEMTQIVEKAMNNANKASAKQKALIDKLASEFALELNNIDLRVKKVEKFTDSTLKVGFDTLMTYGADNPPVGQEKVKGNEAFMSRFRINLSGNFNEKTKFNARIGTSYGLAGMGRTTTALGANTNVYCDVAYFTFSDVLGFDNVKLGRQGVNELGGNLAKREGNDGISFEKKLSASTTLRTGIEVAYADNNDYSKSHDFEFVSLDSKLNKDSGVSVMYFNNNIERTSSTTTVGYNGSKIGGISAYQKLGKWTLLGEYDRATLDDASSNAPTTHPHAYAVQISTGKPISFFLNPQTMCDINKPGDDAFTIAYHYLGAGIIPKGFTSWQNATANSQTYSPDFTDNIKGWAIDYQYTLMKGLAIDFTYQQLKYAATTGGTAIAGGKVNNVFAIALQGRF